MSARTGAAAKQRAVKPVSAAPIQLKKRSVAAAREPLFSIDGVDYTMPVTVELGDSIGLASILRAQPTEDAKGVELVRWLCGHEALSALMGDATMSRAEWRRIVELLKELAFGPEEGEDEAGN